LKASGGRKHHVRRTIDFTEINKMKADGMGATAIAKALNVSRTIVYKALDQAVGYSSTRASICAAISL
jgi:hypothetical protein